MSDSYEKRVKRIETLINNNKHRIPLKCKSCDKMKIADPKIVSAHDHSWIYECRFKKLAKMGLIELNCIEKGMHLICEPKKYGWGGTKDGN